MMKVCIIMMVKGGFLVLVREVEINIREFLVELKLLNLV